MNVFRELIEECVLLQFLYTIKHYKNSNFTLQRCNCFKYFVYLYQLCSMVKFHAGTNESSGKRLKDSSRTKSMSCLFGIWLRYSLIKRLCSHYRLNRSVLFQPTSISGTAKTIIVQVFIQSNY